MKHHSPVISILIIIAVLAFVGFYVMAPKQAGAPANNEDVNVPTDTAETGTSSVETTIVSIKESSPDAPTIDIEYPQFPDLSRNLNAAIAASVSMRLSDFGEIVEENEKARKATSLSDEAASPLSAYSFSTSWTSAQTNDRYVSIVIRYDSYAGGANENQELETFNYDVAADKFVAPCDLFSGRPDCLTKIASIARADLLRKLEQVSGGDVITAMLDAGTVSVPENYTNFTFTDTEITFYFPKYSVAPGSFGEQRVIIPRDAIK